MIFDSSEIIALERNRETARVLIAGREDEPFGISVITVAELLHGVERADTEARRIRRQARPDDRGNGPFPRLQVRHR